MLAKASQRHRPLTADKVNLICNILTRTIQERREAENQHEPGSPPETSGDENGSGIETHQKISVQFMNHKVGQLTLTLVT